MKEIIEKPQRLLSRVVSNFTLLFSVAGGRQRRDGFRGSVSRSHRPDSQELQEAV